MSDDEFAGLGTARLGRAGHGTVWQGEVCIHKIPPLFRAGRDTARLGLVWLGKARRGAARRGS
jgi:hypothetical protein